MKDLFSRQADAYKKYRPVYPQALYDYILSFISHKHTALDVATGNGQAATVLARHFKKVLAIDSSAAQLANAPATENIEYYQCAAEQTFFKPHTFDLITVAQAYHWLQHEAFATEAKRIAKPGAVLAVWGYDRFQMANAALNSVINQFYNEIVGPYWDAERRSVENHYEDLPFPYNPLPAASFAIEDAWTKNQLLGYLSSWSSVQTYTSIHKASPIPLIENEVCRLMGDNSVPVNFPLFLLLGRI